MDNQDLYLSAIEYINAGFAIFPLKPRSKEPYTAHGVKDASNDASVVKGWWQKWPNANIAIATGQKSGGLCVLDLDIDEAKGLDGYKTLRDWQSTHGVIVPSWLSQTGRGGYHYFFKASEPVKNRVNLLPAVDVRGDGGYIVAPPSLHPNGNSYHWVDRCSPNDVELAVMDNNIRYLLHSDDASYKNSYLAPNIIPEGERNHSLFKFACMMQAKGASDEAIYAATKAENETKCNPPINDRELRLIVKSALNYDKGKPIYVNSNGEAVQGKREPIFSLDKNGNIQKTWQNITEAIEYDEELYGKIRYNELSNSIFVFGNLPWESEDTYRPWRDSDDNNLKMYLEKTYGFSRSDKIMDALSIVANKNRFNPVTDELNKIYAETSKEACQGAIRRLLVQYMGCEDSDYHFEVMKVYMLGAICRAFHAGCKFDYTIILFGKQGFGKSEFVRRLALCPEWFNDNFNTFDGDKAAEKLNGMWIIELAELKALKSSKDAETVKAFLTSQFDYYRAPYSRRAEQRPRMCVFAGTTNNMNVFVDKTGNRRFWPIITRKGYETKSLFDADVDSVTNDFRLAWAEAMHFYHEASEKPILKLPRDIELQAEALQNQFSEEDYRVGIIQNWLDNTNVDKICVAQIIEYALETDLERMPKHCKREVQEILENEIQGWHRVQNNNMGRMRFTKYGLQIAFMRDI